jgi:hypothetical protein
LSKFIKICSFAACHVLLLQCFFTIFNLRSHWKQLHKDLPVPANLAAKQPAASSAGDAAGEDA